MGAPARRGHIQLSIDGKTYGAHRLAWLYVYGTWPKYHIDHINRIPSDNRISNLRLATMSENRCNSPGKKGKELPKGVHWNYGRYVAHVSKNWVTVFSKRFRSIDEAAEAARIARDIFHGEFANHDMDPL
jgi:AP2 domain./HNH endonuclease.